MKRREFLTLTGSVAAAALLAGCGGASSTAASTASSASTSGDLAAPTDFTADPESGEFSFTSNDENVGYYFVRVFPVLNGVESDAYVASSSRINGGKTGTITGSFDASTIGWGTYHIKLISFAAAGTGAKAPDSVILTADYGVGGVLERPEMLVITDGSEAQFIVDHYTLSDYKEYQYLPIARFTVYSDAECTTEVKSEERDLSTLTMDTHPAGAYIWEYSNSGNYPYVNGATLLPEVTMDDLEPGAYYVTCTAISGVEEIADSQPSEAVAFTVTAEAPDYSFTGATTSLWQDPTVMGMPCAVPGTYTDRVDFGGTQTTSAALES